MLTTAVELLARIRHINFHLAQQTQAVVSARGSSTAMWWQWWYGDRSATDPTRHKQLHASQTDRRSGPAADLFKQQRHSEASRHVETFPRERHGYRSTMLDQRSCWTTTTTV